MTGWELHWKCHDVRSHSWGKSLISDGKLARHYRGKLALSCHGLANAMPCGHCEVTIVGQTYVVWKSFPGCHDHGSVRAPGLGPTAGATSRYRGGVREGWRHTKRF